MLRLLHKGESLCCFRDSALVTYGGMLPSDLTLSALRFILSAKSGQSCKQDCETVDFCNSLHRGQLPFLRWNETFPALEKKLSSVGKLLFLPWKFIFPPLEILFSKAGKFLENSRKVRFAASLALKVWRIEWEVSLKLIVLFLKVKSTSQDGRFARDCSFPLAPCKTIGIKTLSLTPKSQGKSSIGSQT